ncbi:N-acyl amino acid synthase FeeM domain-containing protein [Kaistella sp.]|uniref:N-acyl amino acid synthase FeeM domain-containing protein n=1 Tax=Kaistella sp. TaxID=2782235 RepID=UPI003C633510
MIHNIEYYTMCHENVDELIQFVINENHLHHREVVTTEQINSTRQLLCAEEKQYFNSHIFVAMSNNTICGSIRIFQKTATQILPIEKNFNINVEDLAGAGIPIYHIGRFAVSKGADKRGFRIFKTLMVLALNVATREKGGTVFAECDVKLLRTIRLLGIEAEAIGAPIHYLGSETIPIQLPWTGYQSFLNRNRDLLHNELGIFWQ